MAIQFLCLFIYRGQVQCRFQLPQKVVLRDKVLYCYHVKLNCIPDYRLFFLLLYLLYHSGQGLWHFVNSPKLSQSTKGGDYCQSPPYLHEDQLPRETNVSKWTLSFAKIISLADRCSSALYLSTSSSETFKICPLMYLRSVVSSNAECGVTG